MLLSPHTTDGDKTQQWISSPYSIVYHLQIEAKTCAYVLFKGHIFIPADPNIDQESIKQYGLGVCGLHYVLKSPL